MSNESHEALLNDFLDAHRAVWSGRGDEAERHALCKEAEASRAALLTAMLAASPQPPGSEGWRDIASAPKDGTRILIAFRHLNFQFAKTDEDRAEWQEVCEAYWTSINGGGWVWHGLAGAPVAWMPLPAAPQPQKVTT